MKTKSVERLQNILIENWNLINFRKVYFPYKQSTNILHKCYLWANLSYFFLNFSTDIWERVIWLPTNPIFCCSLSLTTISLFCLLCEQDSFILHCVRVLNICQLVFNKQEKEREYALLPLGNVLQIQQIFKQQELMSCNKKI